MVVVLLENVVSGLFVTVTGLLDVVSGLEVVGFFETAMGLLTVVGLEVVVVAGLLVPTVEGLEVVFLGGNLVN